MFEGDSIAWLTGLPKSADPEGLILMIMICVVFFCLGVCAGCGITAKQLDNLYDMIEKKEGKV